MKKNGHNVSEINERNRLVKETSEKDSSAPSAGLTTMVHVFVIDTNKFPICISLKFWHGDQNCKQGR